MRGSVVEGCLGSSGEAPDAAQDSGKTSRQRTSALPCPNEIPDSLPYTCCSHTISPFFPLLPFPIVQAKTLELPRVPVSLIHGPLSDKSCVSPLCSISRRGPESDHFSTASTLLRATIIAQGNAVPALQGPRGVRSHSIAKAVQTDRFPQTNASPTWPVQGGLIIEKGGWGWVISGASSLVCPCHSTLYSHVVGWRSC